MHKTTGGRKPIRLSSRMRRLEWESGGLNHLDTPKKAISAQPESLGPALGGLFRLGDLPEQRAL